MAELMVSSREEFDSIVILCYDVYCKQCQSFTLVKKHVGSIKLPNIYGRPQHIFSFYRKDMLDVATTTLLHLNLYIFAV